MDQKQRRCPAYGQHACLGCLCSARAARTLPARGACVAPSSQTACIKVGASRLTITGAPQFIGQKHSIMSKSDLNAVYTEQFKNHPEGHALYFKVPGHSMKPGSCGYFNESGHWRSIVQIAEVEPATLASDGWKPPARLITTENQTGTEWPIKLSESVQERKIEAKATAQ
jgi:hypothetical protein